VRFRFSLGSELGGEEWNRAVIETTCSCHESCFPRPAYRYSMVIVQRRKGRSVVVRVRYFERCRWGNVSIGLVLDGARGWLIIDRSCGAAPTGGERGGRHSVATTSVVRRRCGNAVGEGDGMAFVRTGEASFSLLRLKRGRRTMLTMITTYSVRSSGSGDVALRGDGIMGKETSRRRYDDDAYDNGSNDHNRYAIIQLLVSWYTSTLQ
jgi:hypothetical protein